MNTPAGSSAKLGSLLYGAHDDLCRLVIFVGRGNNFFVQRKQLQSSFSFSFFTIVSNSALVK